MLKTSIKKELDKAIKKQGRIIKRNPFPGLMDFSYMMVDGKKTIGIKKFLFLDEEGFCNLTLYSQGENSYFNDIEFYDKKGDFFVNCFEDDEIDMYIENIYKKDVFIYIDKDIYISEEILKLNKKILLNLTQSDFLSGFGYDLQEKLQNL